MPSTWTHTPPALSAWDMACLGLQAPYQIFSEPLRVAVGGWATSELVANVASILLTEALGYRVELVRAGAPAVRSDERVLSRLAAAKVDLDFEVWPDANTSTANGSWAPPEVELLASVSIGSFGGWYETRANWSHSASIETLFATGAGAERYSQVTVRPGDPLLAEAAELCRRAAHAGLCDADGIWRPPPCRSGAVNCVRCAV